MSLHVLESSNELRFENSLRALDFEFSNLAVANRAQLVPNRSGRVGRRRGRRFGVNDEDADLGWRVVVRGDRRCESSFAHGTIQSRCAATAEHRREKIERRRVGVRRAGRSPAERKLGLSNVPAQLAITKA